MRTIIVLTLATTLTGCSHMRGCKPSLFSTCKVRQPASCCDDPCKRDTGWKCPAPCSSSKKLGLGWKEVKVPCLKLKDRCQTPASCGEERCRTSIGCPSTEICCDRQGPGCCVDDQVAPTEVDAVPVPVLPRQSAQMQNLGQRPRQQVQQWNVESQIPGAGNMAGFAPMQTAPVNGVSMQGQQNHAMNTQGMATSASDLARRTQALEIQVNEIHNMLQKRHAINTPADNGVIMLPKPQWRTMDGVPPVPNAPIEQTSGYHYGSPQWRSAQSPQMWPHSPQNIQRSMLR